MPPARDRAALVDAIRDPMLPPRPRQHAAEELLRKFPAATKTLRLFMGLFPRPVSPDTFEICCAAYERAPDRPGFRVITTKEEES
jgi:hypothetical protein